MSRLGYMLGAAVVLLLSGACTEPTPEPRSAPATEPASRLAAAGRAAGSGDRAVDAARRETSASSSVFGMPVLDGMVEQERRLSVAFWESDQAMDTLVGGFVEALPGWRRVDYHGGVKLTEPGTGGRSLYVYRDVASGRQVVTYYGGRSSAEVASGRGRAIDEPVAIDLPPTAGGSAGVNDRRVRSGTSSGPGAGAVGPSGGATGRAAAGGDVARRGGGRPGAMGSGSSSSSVGSERVRERLPPGPAIPPPPAPGTDYSRYEVRRPIDFTKWRNNPPTNPRAQF